MLTVTSSLDPHMIIELEFGINRNVLVLLFKMLMVMSILMLMFNFGLV